jgi:protein-S-isoprenylcysteine O-methyltransferase Ste14
VAKRTNQPTIPVLLTVLDGLAALRYGREIWTVWSGIIWIRLLMCLLAGVWLASLVNVWACAARRSDRSLECTRERFVPRTVAISVDAHGGADV